ncbi:MAG: helix-turn-helix domain-containing protein [Firmicutes bacterium]|nr:helix-turn-helix domain-containing protein [[Eubacterium] siraeum]MCM1487071.1 helix-turn-helix domain-containing protein [Bacillota bacterium]
MGKSDQLTTEDLWKMVCESKNICSDWDGMSSYMESLSFHEKLFQLSEQHGVNAAQLGKKALLSRSFSYQIFSGERIPQRDIILRIAIVLELDIADTQRLLCLASRGGLYPKVKRDAIIIYCLKNNFDIYKTDELLVGLEQKPLL